MAISVPVREVGFEEWLAKINSACGRFCARTLGPGFSGAMQEFRAHALRMSVVDATQTRLYRTQKEINRSDGSHFFTVFQLRGSSLMEQGDRQAVLSAGDVTLIDASRTSSFTFQQDSRQISLLMPRSYFERSARFSDLQFARRLDGQSSMARLSRQLVLGCMQDAQMSAPESEAILSAVATLLRPAMIEPEVGAEVFPQAFTRTLAFIDTHIQSPQLRPEWIAAELGISVRSLYRMFARQGLVVAQYIKHRRLDLCAQALRTAPERQKLVTIGHDWGFSDHSHFSTAFKSRFGVSPSEYRKQYQ